MSVATSGREDARWPDEEGDDEEEKRDPEAELRGLVGCWDRYCPQLREVQLLQGFVWRKAEERSRRKQGTWEKRRYRWVDGVRDYGL